MEGALDVLEVMRKHALEEVVAVNDPATGLLGFIVIHDTSRGPGIGGCRLAPYKSSADALADGVALAIAMTRKCALAGLNAGGAKGVFIEHPGIKDRAAMLRAAGRYVESLGGRFYTSGDLGLGPADIAEMRKTSRFVAVPDDARLDLSGGVAEGVLAGMREALIAAGLEGELAGRRVAVQGVGAMGVRVARQLVAAGATVLASEINPARRAALEGTLDVEWVDVDGIYDLEVDVFSPCAISGVLTAETVKRLRCKAVVGAANNQLGDDVADAAMFARGIWYAPDYAVNSGAIILSAKHYLEHLVDGRETISLAAVRIAETTRRIFHFARASGEAPGVVAARLASEAIRQPKTTEHQWWPIQ